MTTLTPDEYKKAREKMVRTQLVTTGVQKKSIIDHVGALEREIFVPEEFKLISYSAKEIPLADKRFMLNPMDLGLILDRIDFDNTQKVLIIADGTGYVTALLSKMIDQVVTLDNVNNFKKNLDPILNSLDIQNVSVIESDVTEGWAAQAPYDLIFINGSVQQIPDALFDQLAPNGKILTALKKPFISHAVFQFKLQDAIQTERLFECSISLLPEFSKKSKFVF
ncbi:MAG: protein-L-isoaspartate(D-aspartate) O-methyltransferase [Alphaproteobacteria bacterium]|jgi:protein-L-isoaspartate(D-aspartate) O-methyltransferase